MTLSNEYKRKVISLLSKDAYLRENSEYITVDAPSVEKYFIIFQQKYKHVYGEEQWNTFISELLEKREANIQNAQLIAMLNAQKKLMKKYEHIKKN
jgi:hypothetical protein